MTGIRVIRANRLCPITTINAVTERKKRINMLYRKYSTPFLLERIPIVHVKVAATEAITVRRNINVYDFGISR